MLADEDKSIRVKAVDAIMKIRHNKVKSTVERTDSGLYLEFQSGIGEQYTTQNSLDGT